MDDHGAAAGRAWAIALEADAASAALVEAQAFAVVLEAEQPVSALVAGGTQGQAGPPGPEGGAALPRTAGQLLSALRAVYELNGQVFYLDYRDAEHIDLLLGVTLTAASLGSPINVQRSGALDDSNWNWTPGRVWLGIEGALTQTPPADGFDVLLGAAVSATRITLNIQDPIELE